MEAKFFVYEKNADCLWAYSSEKAAWDKVKGLIDDGTDPDYILVIKPEWVKYPEKKTSIVRTIAKLEDIDCVTANNLQE